MRSLFIVRHSKAVDVAPDHTDFGRCLADSGVSKAQLISEVLSKDVSHVDLMLSSPACRAMETAQIFAQNLGYDASRISTHEALYHFGGIERAMHILSQVDDQHQTVFLFGHNPTFNALSWHLCPEFRDAMPTSSVVGVELSIKKWADIHRSRGKLITYLTKRRLGS